MHGWKRKAAQLGSKRNGTRGSGANAAKHLRAIGWKTVTVKAKFKEVTTQNPKTSMKIKADGT